MRFPTPVMKPAAARGGGCRPGGGRCVSGVCKRGLGALQARHTELDTLKPLDRPVSPVSSSPEVCEGVRKPPPRTPATNTPVGMTRRRQAATGAAARIQGGRGGPGSSNLETIANTTTACPQFCGLLLLLVETAADRLHPAAPSGASRAFFVNNVTYGARNTRARAQCASHLDK